MSERDEPQRAIVVDVQMPFFSIVVLMAMWALASIPAISQLFGLSLSAPVLVSANLNDHLP